MKKLILTLSILLWSGALMASPTAEQPDRNEEIYNLQNTLGLKGYDPVAYFQEGGSEALEGSSSLSADYGGVTYNFANQDNLDMFLESPTKYEPTYGGWCAWAMANEAYADIDPELFTIHGNRSHFFISKGAKARFDKDLMDREADADNYWTSESGEMPRL